MMDVIPFERGYWRSWEVAPLWFWPLKAVHDVMVLPIAALFVLTDTMLGVDDRSNR